MKKIMKVKQWIKMVLMLFLLITSFIALFNYIIDPYGMNNHIKIEGINKYKESNTGYAFRFKTDVYKKGKFDNLLIGTSRVGVMDPQVVDKILGGKTFNFASSGSITQIQKELFLYALKNNNIKNLIYGIDFLSLNGDIKLEKKFKEFCHVQAKLNANKTIYNFDLYFNYTTLVDSVKLIERNRREKVFFETRYLEDGRRDYIGYENAVKTGKFKIEKKIKQSLQSYYHGDISGGYQNYKFSNKYLENVKEIIDFCKSNNINIWVYIPPMYRDHFDALKAYGIYAQFEEFKRALISLTNYVDFTGHNSITDNKYYFWDGSHLRNEYTSLVMGRVLNSKEMVLPKDFGVYVTKENIEMHLKEIRESIQPFDIHKLIEEPI